MIWSSPETTPKNDWFLVIKTSWPTISFNNLGEGQAGTNKNTLFLCVLGFDGMYGFAMIRLDAMSLFQKDDNMGSSVFNPLISRTQLANEVLYLLYAQHTIDP